MDSSSALSQALGPVILAALQARATEDQTRVLVAQLGQKLELILFGAAGNTVKLRLPNGQVFEAEGRLPYPLGTRLTVLVQAPASEGGAPRLKLLEAAPPPAPAILAPLLQGEAAPLLARMVQPEVPQALRPLLRLLESLQDPAVPQAPPASRILAALESLPPPALQALRQFAPVPSAGLPELAQVIRAWIGKALGDLASPQAPAAAPQAAPAVPPAQGGVPTPGAAAPLPGSMAPAPPPGRPTALTTPEAAASRNPGALPAGAAPAPPRPGPAVPLLLPEAPGRPLAPQAASDAGVAHALRPDPAAAGLQAEGAAPESLPLLPLPGEEAALAFQPPAPEPGATPGARTAPLPARAATDLASLLIPRLEAQLWARSEAPPEARDPLRALVRQLLQGLEAPAPTRSNLPGAAPGGASAPGTPEAPPGTREGVRPGDAPPVPAAGPGKVPVPAPPELPASWERWIGSAMKALADPQVSPREAPFHLAQAREGTAFFELPLPWAPPGAALQIWIESGLPEGEEGRPPEETRRILVGLSLTALGETRVGLQQSPSALQVRIWTERPDLLRGRLEELRQDLEDGETPVDLRVLPLGGGPDPVPSLRTILAGRGFQALG